MAMASKIFHTIISFDSSLIRLPKSFYTAYNHTLLSRLAIETVGGLLTVPLLLLKRIVLHTWILTLELLWNSLGWMAFLECLIAGKLCYLTRHVVFLRYMCPCQLIVFVQD